MSTSSRPQAQRSGPRPENHVFVVFGATGDLAKRKILPACYHMWVAGLLPEEFRVIGSAPQGTGMSDADFIAYTKSVVTEFGNTKPSGAAWDEFASRLSFGAASPGDTSPLVSAVDAAQKAIGGSRPPRRLFHLAVPPAAFESVIGMLGSSGLVTANSRVIIEKPFGEDLESARKLNDTVHGVFDESQVFRIDHFLGKESVDNLLAFRFANGIFEPIWNRDHLHYVQIDVPETLSVEDRGSFYDATGAYRDMVVTHLFQVLGVVAMEPPTSLEAKPLRDEKCKVFDALMPVDVRHVVRGQYDGYRSVPGVRPGSGTETMVALRVQVDNWRWHGVPFYLRSGKNLAVSGQVITLGFRNPPLRMFRTDRRDAPAGAVNEIVIDFADPGSISLQFMAKEPGPDMILGATQMKFSYADSFAQSMALEGYERLILLAMLGDQSLFTRADAIERVWQISEPLLTSPPSAEIYSPGTWGPAAVDKLIEPYRWHLH